MRFYNAFLRMGPLLLTAPITDIWIGALERKRIYRGVNAYGDSMGHYFASKVDAQYNFALVLERCS